MAEARASLLESGEWSALGARYETPVLCSIQQQRIPGQHGEHLFCVGLPICRQVQTATRLQAIDHKIDEIRLYQSTLVVTLFMPGIRKEYLHRVQRRCRDAIS